MQYLIANWKSNETITQTYSWLEQFRNLAPPQVRGLETIICMPFTALAEANRYVSQYSLPLKAGAQDVSIYSSGPHTGGITASMLSELVSFCLVGHSERRREIGDNSETVALKTRSLLESSVTPIICIDAPYLEEQVKALFNLQIPLEHCIFAYEPLAAIGTGQVADPQQIQSTISEISFLTDSACPVVYGGSVSPDNLSSILDLPGISGVLVGSNSLNPATFVDLISHFHETQSVQI